MCAVALTFDDGPHPEWTPRVLEALDAAGVRATFFLQGDRLVRRPDIARAAAARGHSLQAHCFQHRSHRELAHADIDTDISRLLVAMDAAGLQAPAFWRPPFGDIASPASNAVARRHGLRLVTWTVETCDWARDSAEAVLAELLAERRPAAALGPDSVVLMHDSVGAHTAALVGLLADEIARRGWSTALLAEHAAAATPRRPFKDCRQPRRANRR